MVGQCISSIIYLNDDVVYTSRTSYLNNRNKYKPAADFILEHDDSFYRFDKTKHPLINTPMMLGIRGFTNSTSTLNRDTIDFLQHMGISSKSHWSKYYGGTPAFDSFLALKYIITDPEYDIPNGYVHLYDSYDDNGDVETSVYENPYALSVAYAVNSKIKDIHLAYPSTYKKDIEAGKYEEYTAYNTPPERMNVMMGAMLGTEEAVPMFVAVDNITESDVNITYKPVSDNHSKYSPTDTAQSSSMQYDFVAESDGIVYMYIPTNYPREVSVLVNGVDKGSALANETDRMISLGSFSEGDDISVSLSLKEDVFYLQNDEPLFWYLDMSVYKQSFAALAENEFNIEKWNDTCFSGTINIPTDRTTVFTSIPYDANWRVWIDGEEVEVYENLEALVAFDAPVGAHEIVIKYVHKQLHIGLCITAVSIALLLAICFIDRAVKKKRESFEVEIVELPDDENNATKEEENN